MSRPVLEVADIFREHGAAWRKHNAGHLSLGQLKVMSAIENCRTAVLGGHVARCDNCAHTLIAYNSERRTKFLKRCHGTSRASSDLSLLPKTAPRGEIRRSARFAPGWQEGSSGRTFLATSDWLQLIAKQ